MRLGVGGKGSHLEPPARLAAIGVFNQPDNNRRLVVRGRACVAFCRGPGLCQH
jgi:hypothetical protein